MNFLKNLFKKKPIVQERINLGKITAIIHFKNGQTLEKTFEGWMGSSTYFGEFGVGWLDHYSTAEKQFSDWFSFMSERKFIQFDENIHFPISEIAKITTESQDHFIETKRGQ